LKTKLKIVLFAYNFPHRKTIDFVEKIYDCGFEINLILAANFIPIKSPRSAFLFDKKEPKTSIQDKATQKSIPLYQVQHNSAESQDLLRKYNVNFGIIAGARILKHQVINMLSYGILNFHPAMLPKIRGLDSMLWSIYKDVPLGVTAHLINDKIYAGFLVVQKKIIILNSDDLQSLYEKNYQLQLKLIPISLNLILRDQTFKTLKMNEYNNRMSYDKQIEVKDKLPHYIRKYTNKKDGSKN